MITTTRRGPCTRRRSLLILLFITKRPFIFFLYLAYITYQVKYLLTILLYLTITIRTYFSLSTPTYIQLLSLINFISTFTTAATLFYFSIYYLLQFVVISFYTFCFFLLHVICGFVFLFFYTVFTQFHTTVFTLI